MKSNPQHIVLVTAWFPPRQGIAVNRMVGFVKYLYPHYKNLTVITESSDIQNASENVFGAKVYYVKHGSMFRRAKFFAGESRFFHYLKVIWNLTLNFIFGALDRKWIRGVTSQLDVIHRNRPIDVIISSYAPASCHIAAFRFLKHHKDIKWIADMRDEMSLNPHLNNREREFLSSVESMVNERADAVTSVSKPILDDFRKIMPSVKYFLEIRNGFDHDFTFPIHFNDIFTITYCGTFYGSRKPDSFFAGLSIFLTRHPDVIRLKFVGVHRNFFIPNELENYIEFLPQISASNSVLEMAASDANLLILPKVSGKGVYSGKIFEYLSVHKPIIGVVDPFDVAAELISELNAGFIADFDDPESIAVAIESAYLLWKEKKCIQSDVDKIKQLHRRYSVAELEKLIDKIMEK